MNNNDGFSVVTVTCRYDKIENIISNYANQDLMDKELIVVINNNNINISDFDSYVNSRDDIHIYKLSQDITQGTCLNFGIDKSKFKYIAKFDDDDYYGPYYLQEAYHAFNFNNNCQIVAKNKLYYYLEANKSLMLKKGGRENSYSTRGSGSTICFKKTVFNFVKFKDINSAVDTNFYDDCAKYGFRVYLTSRFNHIVFRNSDINKHTWKVTSESLMTILKVVKNNTTFKQSMSLVNSNNFIINKKQVK